MGPADTASTRSVAGASEGDGDTVLLRLIELESERLEVNDTDGDTDGVADGVGSAKARSALGKTKFVPGFEPTWQLLLLPQQRTAPVTSRAQLN